MRIWNLMASKFQGPNRSKTRGGRLEKPRLNRLSLEALEERTTPASFASFLEEIPLGGDRFAPAMVPQNIQLPQSTPISYSSITFLDQELVGRVPREELFGSLVVTLQPGEDPLVQIGKVLSGYRGIETVRIISHGRDGALVLGGKVVDEDALNRQITEVSAWGRSLAPDADILLYGCSVASTEAGRQFVARLALATGADVAASSDPTGARGDLVLEYATGPVTGSLVAIQRAWEASGVQLPSEGDFEYTTSGGNATITRYTGAGGAVTVPSTLDGLPVTTIGERAFLYNTSLTSIALPNSVTTIGDSAFRRCSGLTSITLPNSVTTIGYEAFYGCTGLTSITLPNSITTIEGGVFYGCTSLTSITLPNSITTIGGGAFSDCTGLTAIYVNSANLNYSSSSGILFNKDQTTVIAFPAGKTGAITLPSTVTTIGNYAFVGCTGLTSITLPNSLTTIGDQAFVRCTGLTSISLGNSITTIGVLAFRDCTGLTSITLPNSITTIGGYAFYYCTGLTSITLPASVTTIGYYAFSGCTGLTSIYALGNAPTLGSEVFSKVTATVYYYRSATGFTNPWGGLTTQSRITPTTNTVVTSATPSVYGDSITLTTTVVASLGVATGTVTFKNGSTVLGTATLSSGVASFSLSTLAAGSHSLTTVYTATTNFDASTTPTLTQTISAKGLTITADAKSKIYGQALPLFSTTVTGLVNGDTSGNITGLGVSSTATGSSGVGNYSLDPTGTNANYAITLVKGSLEVTQAPLTVSADNKSKIYGQALPLFTTTLTGLVNGDTSGNITGLGATTTASASSIVGDYSIVASGTNTNYQIVLVDGTIAVTKASLTITADAKSKLYGAVLPQLSTTLTGLVNGDTSGNITGLGATTTATASSIVGDYSIVASGTNTNYQIVLVDGTIAVTKAPLTITADAKSKLYGAVLPQLSTTLTGLVNGDTSGNITGLGATTTASASSIVGDYPIVASGTNLNYQIVLEDGIIAVTKAPLTITADATSKLYGAVLPQLSTILTGLVNGDNNANIAGLAATTTATASSIVGDYPIVPSGTNSNYSVALVNGLLTVTKAALTITADAKSKVYGANLPAFTTTVAGLVNGDTTDNITGLGATTTATASSIVGDYPIVASGTNTNYQIVLVDGIIAVTKAPLTITADAKSKLYGAVLPQLSTTLTGLVNGDNNATIAGLAATTTATLSSIVGDYPIVASGTNTNYQIVLVDGTIAVTKAPLTITADAKSKLYGAVLPQLSTTVTGLVNGDNYDTIGGLAATTTASASSIVGDYSIVASGTNANYSITKVDGTIEVTRVPLTLSADNKTKVYGNSLPSFTITLTGLVNGDTSAQMIDLGTSVNASASSNAGTYTITPTGSNTNYTVTLTAGNLTVSKAPITLTAQDKTKKYGEALPGLDLTVSGLVNQDTQANLANLGVFTTATQSSVAGPYDLIPNGNNPNYSFTYTYGKLEITKANLTLKGPTVSKLYGASLPVFRTIVEGLVNGDTASDLIGLASFCVANQSSPVGDYPISVSADSPNYLITTTKGNLAITKAALTLTAANKSYIRGIEPVPAFTYTYSGFVNGDTGDLLNGVPTLTTTAKTYGPFGTYPISVDVSTVSTPNYTLAVINGTLTLNKVSPTIIPIDSIPILTTTNGAANGITIWGSSGKKLGTINAYPGYTGRIVTVLGDLNGDGVPDIITGVGAGAAPLLRRFDGRTLKEIGQGFYAYDKAFLGGMSVAAADVDGDGLCEIITGTGNGSAPHVRVRKMDGTIMGGFYAYAPNFTRGVNLITGDINGDGKAEIVTTPNAGGGPHTKVFDGTGKASASFFAYESTFTGGFSLALADTDGNGTKEIITMSYAGRKTAGRVFDHSGVMLKEWFPNGSVTSGAMVVAGDLTGDKVDEIVTVSLLGTPATMKVFDGGLKLGGSVSPYATNFAAGVGLRLVDTNGDGIKEIVTAPGKGMAPQVKRWDGKLKLLDSLFATTSSFTGGVWLD